jgi:hypothetical protein
MEYSMRRTAPAADAAGVTDAADSSVIGKKFNI